MDGQALQASVQLINQKAKFTCEVDGKEPVIVDYIPPLGDGEGYTSLELLLISLATCVGSTVKFMLTNHLKKTITGLKVSANGRRRKEHPTGFTAITLNLELHSPDLDAEALEKTLELSKETYSPVWAMLRNNTEIITEYTIIPA